MAGDHELLRLADGRAGVGEQRAGQLGVQMAADLSGVNPPDLGLRGAARLRLGAFHACIQLVDQRVVCAGNDDVVRARDWAEVMGFGRTLASLRSGEQNVCAVRQGDAAVLCWGGASRAPRAQRAVDAQRAALGDAGPVAGRSRTAGSAAVGGARRKLYQPRSGGATVTRSAGRVLALNPRHFTPTPPWR